MNIIMIMIAINIFLKMITTLSLPQACVPFALMLWRPSPVAPGGAAEGREEASWLEALEPQSYNELSRGSQTQSTK